jgi:hypothetical protein
MDSNFKSQCNYCQELNHVPKKYTLELYGNESISIDGVPITRHGVPTTLPYEIDPDNFTGLGLIENKDLQKI